MKCFSSLTLQTRAPGALVEPSESLKRATRSTLRRNVSLARSPASLLITSRGIQQPSRPSLHTTQSHKPTRLPAVYTYSCRATSSPIRTETRLGKRASYGMHLLPAPQVKQVVAPVALEYLPAQQRHASVDRHEAVRAALLHQLPSAATRHAPRLYLSSAPHFALHTRLGQ
jgi:hypothetical protein